MWPLPTGAANALSRSHPITVRATAYPTSLGEVPDLPVSSGTVAVDATSQIRRTAEIGIADAALWPADPFGILSPLGAELAVEYGIVLPGGAVVWIPLIRGPITDVARQRPTANNDAALTVSVADRSARVAEARLDQPSQTLDGASTVAEIQRLITEVLPGVTVTDLTGSTKTAPQLDIERERWADGIEPLADSLGAECYADPTGQFVIRPQPALTGPAVWVVATGPGGVLIAVDEQRTRQRTYNRVVALGQRVDGTPPVWAAVSDEDPNSPTWIGGPFGIKPRFYSSPLLTTTEHCVSAAAALLARTTGMHGSVTLTIVPNPALDTGDVLVVRDEQTVSAHIIDTLTVPLTPGQSQQITTRSIQLPPETA